MFNAQNIYAYASIFEAIALRKPEAPDWSPLGEFLYSKYREGVPESKDTDFPRPTI